MENVGNTPATDYGTLHGPNGSQEAKLGGTTMPSMGALSDDFHVYSVEWKAGEVDFLFDDHPSYIILNLAIGGNWPGSPRREHAAPRGAPRRLGARARPGALSAALCGRWRSGDEGRHARAELVAPRRGVERGRIQPHEAGRPSA
jgi:hypothetical protein